MLIIADEKARRIGGEGGFPRAGEAKEQADVALFIDVGRAVHGQYVLLRKEVVLHRKHGLLHFPGVAHARQEHFPLGEVQDDHAFGVRPVSLGIAHEAWGIQDLPGVPAGGVVAIRSNEQ